MEDAAEIYEASRLIGKAYLLPPHTKDCILFELAYRTDTAKSERVAAAENKPVTSVETSFSINFFYFFPSNCNYSFYRGISDAQTIPVNFGHPAFGTHSVEASNHSTAARRWAQM